MTTSTRTGLRAVAAAVCLAGALTACSSSDNTTTTTNTSVAGGTTVVETTTTTTEAADLPTAEELLTKAKSQAEAATSGAMSGDVSMGGQQMKIALKGTADGKSLDVDVTIPEMGQIHVINTGGKYYMQVDETFSKGQGGGVIEAGKWFEIPASMASGIGDQFSFTSLRDNMLEGLDPADVKGEVEESTLDGRDVYVITDTGDSSGSGKITIDKESGNFVAMDGQFTETATGTATASEGNVSLTFSDWNEPIEVTAPAGATVLGG